MDDQQKRLFMALLMCAVVTLVWMTFFAPQPQRRPQVADGSGSGQVATGATGPTGSTAYTDIADGSGQSTDGTGEVLRKAGVDAEVLPKIQSGLRPNVLDKIKNGATEAFR